MDNTRANLVRSNSTWLGFYRSITTRIKLKLTGTPNKLMQPRLHCDQVMGTHRCTLLLLLIIIPTQLPQRQNRHTVCLSLLCTHIRPVVLAIKAKDSSITIQNTPLIRSRRKCEPINRTPRPHSRLHRGQYCPWSTHPPPMYHHTWQKVTQLPQIKPPTLEWGRAALIFTPAVRARVATPASELAPTAVTGGKTRNNPSAQLTLPHASLGQSVTRVTLCCYSNGAGNKEQMRVL